MTSENLEKKKKEEERESWKGTLKYNKFFFYDKTEKKLQTNQIVKRHLSKIKITKTFGTERHYYN